MISQDLHPSPEKPSDSAYAVLEAVDALYLARASEIYLRALEHYILSNSEPNKGEMLALIKLYSAASAENLNKAADILKAALGRTWEPEEN